MNRVLLYTAAIGGLSGLGIAAFPGLAGAIGTAPLHINPAFDAMMAAGLIPLVIIAITIFAAVVITAHARRQGPEELTAMETALHHYAVSCRIWQSNCYPDGFEAIALRDPHGTWELYGPAWQSRPTMFSDHGRTVMENLEQRMKTPSRPGDVTRN